MRIYKRSPFRHIIQWLAGSIAIVITIIIPSGYLYSGYSHLNETTRTKAYYIAEELSEFVFKNPDTWMYREHYYSKIIEKYTSSEHEQSSLSIGQINTSENIYLTNVELDKPFITVEELIYDANTIVATFQIKVSAWPLINGSFYAVMIGFLFGAAVYLTLYLLPMKALSTVLVKLNDTQKALYNEIADKEEALKEAHDMGQKLHVMAMHDHLTGLANRNMYQDSLTKALSQCEKDQSILAVVMIDLNRFKQINDSLGHHIGDALLVEIAKRLKLSLRKNDIVARLGGDEFALILDINSPENAINLCSKIIQTINKPINLKQHNLQINCSASCGIAYYPQDAIDSTQLLQKADVAMYVAKKTSTNISAYNRKLDTNTPERLKLASYLSQSIINNELFLVYQPKIDLKNLSIKGVEALVRWQHPDHGLISPGIFTPLAEESEIIHPLTEWVINTALEQQSKWKRQGIDLEVSINVSGKNLRDENFHHKISAALEKWKVNPANIILEITESVMIDNPQHALTILKAISDQGVRLSIDDFGTGHASLIQLKTFPFDELKIDRSFVKDMIVDSHDAAIVRSAIALAKSLNMRTVAEGIENEKILDLLKDIGCDLAQGYYFCEPLGTNDLIDWIRNTTDVYQMAIN